MIRYTLIIKFLCLGLALGLAVNKSPREAEICNPEECVLPDCRCASTEIPGGLDREETPQFVFFSFDDDVNSIVMKYYREAFYEGDNPDGCPHAATFFISHEYTYYDQVHELYKHGQEISMHSITHMSSTDYWKEISVEGLAEEFSDQRKMMSHFANVPAEDIQGIRLPLLQLSGDNNFQMMLEEDIMYDCSIPTQEFVAPGMWPYTLDYRSIQDCPVGYCPQNSAPGRWVIPMLMWKDIKGYGCSMVDGCPFQPETEDEHFEWMVKNFEETYNSNKAPWGFHVHAAWFVGNDIRFQAFKRLVEYLDSLDDVFIVGESTGLKWIKNPIPLSEMIDNDWSNCRHHAEIDCDSHSCELSKNEEYRYMNVCGKCPNVYPWLGNPLGE